MSEANTSVKVEYTFEHVTSNRCLEASHIGYKAFRDGEWVGNVLAVVMHDGTDRVFARVHDYFSELKEEIRAALINEGGWDEVTFTREIHPHERG